jgi:nucleotide-binding universal stress UspA family protein
MEDRNMIKRILVGLGGTNYTPSAIRYAVDIAQRHQATVTGVTFVDVARLESVGPIPVGGVYWAQLLREHRIKVAHEHVMGAAEEFVQACESAGVGYQVQQEKGNPFDLLISEARYHDLMIFGLKSLFEHDIVSDPHDALIRLVSAGVRPILAVAPEYREVRRVLIAYSGSMESAKTLRRFVQLRLWPDVELGIVTFQHDAASSEAEKLVRDAAAYCRAHGYSPEEDFADGSAKSKLIPYATQWNADLVAIGNSARSLLLRRMFGDTAIHLIQTSDRPLFLCQ